MSKIQYNTIDEVLRRLGTGRSTLYTKVQQGTFPKLIKLSDVVTLILTNRENCLGALIARFSSSVLK